MRRLVPSEVRPAAAVAATCVALTLAVGLLVVATPSARADQTYFVPISKTWVVNGRGYGHGHGMSQYGAEGAAMRGMTYRDIVHFYYPGTSWQRAKGRIRVLVGADGDSDLVVRAAKNLRVRELKDGAHWALASGHGIDYWRLSRAHNGSTAVQFHNGKGWHRWDVPGRRKTLAGDAQFEAPRPISLVLRGGSSERYRGALRLARPYRGSSTRDTVNVLGMDAYVQGVVANEMPASWRQQALRAQAVAARTYAAWERAQNRHGYYQICDTTSCQVYNGVSSEEKSSNDAVKATAGQILTYHGKPAFTQFSSSSGGWTSSGGVRYLPAKRDPYDGFASNPMHSWTTTVSAASIQESYPQIGHLIDLRVTKRNGHGAWNGRVERIVLDGTRGRASLTGDDFRWHYGLYSDWFSIEPTPIIQRWRNLGGPKSPLGDPRSGEHAVGRGSVQEFQHGRIFWNPVTGAREVRGAILTAYRAAKGPTGKLGWPQTGMRTAPGNGHKVRFQRGKIYSVRNIGAHIVRGAILTRWRKAGGAASWLGYPTADVRPVEGGSIGRFQHGVIRWDRSTDRFTIRHL